jgi:hypothetical protein
MALERKDRVKDATTTTGTGTVNLSAVAPTGYRTFVASVTSGSTVRYLIESADSSEWEVGEGVFTDGSPDTLTRVTIYASSNAGSLVNFSAGTKNVSLVATAADFVTDGWQNMEALTYVSADGSTGVASIASDVTGKYTPGMRIRYEQSQALSYYWSFNSSSAADLGTATMSDVGTPTYTAGKFSNALTLNGTNQALSITDAAGFKPTGEFTIGAWIKTSNTGAIKAIFCSYSENTNYAGIQFRISSGNKLEFFVGKNSGLTAADYSLITGATTVTDGSFHYVEVSFRNNFIQLYVDGVLDGSGYCITPVYAATNYVRIGSISQNGNNLAWFNGQIDDLFIINGYALDEKTIKAKYDAQTAQGTGNITVKKYGIITAVGAYSGGVTPITFWGGTDHSLDNSTISNPVYSLMKAPYNFPMNPSKWTVEVTDSVQRSNGTHANLTWYNMTGSSIIIPIGLWNIFTKASVYSAGGSGFIGARMTLSTANNTAGDEVAHAMVNPSTDISAHLSIMKTISLSVKTTLYQNIQSGNTVSCIYIGTENQTDRMIIRAICAYL